MPNIRSTLAAAAQRATGGRERGPSISNTAAPAESSVDYIPELAAIAASILYCSPLPSKEGRPIYILNSAAFPDAAQVDYSNLLCYVLARLPDEEELISGTEYEMIFLAGGQPDSATAEKKQGPDRGWYVQAYHVLSRATRKKLKRLYIVHTRSWVRVLVILLSQIVSRKFSRKIEHVGNFSQLALHMPIERLLIPPSAYLSDRRVSPEIDAPFVTSARAFGARHPFPKNIETGETRLPRVLRETTSFLCLPSNIRTEGLFRIPPHSLLAGVLKEAYDRGQQFIIWKDVGTVFAQPGIPRTLVDEVQMEDAYGVHLAASLIKTWYRELREPIFSHSSYAELQEKHSDLTKPVSPEDLVDLLYSHSPTSLLTACSREVLTRHLLPLLSTIAGHEQYNKMNAENLSVCFVPCLVCGPDQIQDARIMPVVRHILRSAIESWPQLCTGMNIDEKALVRDIDAPADRRDYEDPLDPDSRRPVSQETSSTEESRIDMKDAESPSDASMPERAPVLPPRRRSRAASLKGAVKQALPSLDSLPSLPGLGKKSFPPPAEPEMIEEPPRYSKKFDTDGNSHSAADSPVIYVPGDGFEPIRRAEFRDDSVDNDEHMSSVPENEAVAPQSSIVIPKRKAVSSGARAEDAADVAPPEAPQRTTSDHTALLARLVAQQAALNMAHRINIDAAAMPTPADPDAIKSAPVEPTRPPSGESDLVFRKPLRPASANRQPVQANIHSLAKPIVPTRKAAPGLVAPLPPFTNHVTMPKPRQPSPGLLKRMNSMEPPPLPPPPPPEESRTAALLRPRRLDLKKASVEDLRRLYEERAHTARSLQVAADRRGSA